MTKRMDLKTRVRIVIHGFAGEQVMTLDDLYRSCAWRETGDDLDLEAALQRDGHRIEGDWRTIHLVSP